ncbi:PadR family transcriptional regulator [Parapedobacter indicus]|nr:PadR family transcriptional regulator [Parapedobacter indicus]
MIVDNTQTQMRKGILEYCILSIISRGEIYASDIIGELKQARLLVVEGTLYPLLTRLKNNGLLSYSWKESTSGPPRKYYQITPAGLEVLNKLDTTWEELVFAVRTSMEGRGETSDVKRQTSGIRSETSTEGDIQNTSENEQ